MYRQGSRTLAGPSKATATTLCQKCLQKGHYSYECTVSAQQRPYSARPSRTQQLLNPKLVPKLTSDVPNDLIKKKGVADEQLAKIAQDRSRKRDRGDSDDLGRDAKAMRRSISTSSLGSISTISTNRSRSPSPRKSKPAAAIDRQRSTDQYHSKASKSAGSTRRPRSISFSSSDNSSDASVVGKERAHRKMDFPSRRRDAADSPDLGQQEDVRRRREKSRTPERQRTGPPTQNNRVRSPSPYSKRIALTQAMNR